MHWTESIESEGSRLKAESSKLKIKQEPKGRENICQIRL